MLIDGYVAEQMKKAMLNSEQEQVKVYDAYYNKGVTDGYNQALEDLKFNLEGEQKTYAYNGYSLDTDKWLDSYLKSKLG